VAERVTVQRSHLLSAVPDASADLVLCNPPFHRGTARDSDVAFAMFADAGRALRPGGELWTVFNTHLPYLRALRRLVGPTRVVAQNPGYLVTRSARPT
jgi:16S rRNA (guanine1207-N2)-methyltransferase